MLICMQVFQDALKQYARRKDKNLIRNLSKKRSADVSRHIIMEFYKDFNYTRDTHKKLEWPDKTMNADRLVSALQVLKK